MKQMQMMAGVRKIMIEDDCIAELSQNLALSMRKFTTNIMAFKRTESEQRIRLMFIGIESRVMSVYINKSASDEMHIFSLHLRVSLGMLVDTDITGIFV